MPVLKSNPITIIDSLDNINLELFVSSNLPLAQVLDSTGSISPSWAKTPLVLTPSVYVRNQLVKNPVISWQRRSGGGAYTSQLVSGESVVNGTLTVNKDLLATDANKIITYKCTVQYGTISHSIETSFSLNVLGADGKDGSSVSILGTAYIAESIEECVVGTNYKIYSDANLTTQIVNPAIGDAYLVQGHLFVYAGAEDNQFSCVGNIKGVGITHITGPVSNGLVDTYTIHYSDGTTSTYQIKNGASAALVDITPSALYFKSTTGKNGTFTPEYIYLYPRFQSVTYSNWQYSVDGGVTWVSASGANGLTIGAYNSVANSLRISRDSTLYTDSITSISFRCNTTNSAIYDIVSIAKIYDVVDLQIGGRNLIQKTDETTEIVSSATSRKEYCRTDYDLTSIFDKYGLIEYTLSFDLYSELAGPMQIYLQNGSGAEYAFSKSIQATEEWQRYSFTFIPTHSMPSLEQSYLAFYGVYDSGRIPHIKRVKLEIGNKATDWTPAPEDVSAAIDQESGIVAMLSNESQFFVANASGVPTATSVVLDVIGYKGAAQQNTTVGTITGLPSAGMTATISNNNTQNTKITVAVTTALTSSIADYGVLTIPITIAGKTINKKFNWAKSKAGATGASSVSFEIYSNTGLVFHDEESITLQTQKLYGATNITIGGTTTLQWSKMVNGVWTNTWKYDSGDSSNVPATGETLVVKHSEINGSQLYRCTLTYGGKAYTDIVTITDKTDTYQSNIIALGGNVLTGGEAGRIAYASLFQGANEEDKLLCPIYSSGTTPVANKTYYVLEDGVITTKKYTGGIWVADNTVKQEYLYTWFILDKYTGEQQEIGSGKVIYITNDVISRSGIVQCVIGNVSVCAENFTDANDPIIGSEEPKLAAKGQLWLNTDDGLLYAYDNGWYPVNSGQNRTYTSAPIVRKDCCYYKMGDLWIVGENDSAYTDAKVGTLLIATNDLQDADNWTVAEWKNRLAVDWSNKLYYDEALNTLTDYQKRLSAYMSFEVDGLKIGANNTEFYTKVTPYDLGFYQGSEKVAYVSNKKMYNTSLEVSNDVQIAKHKSDEQPNPQKPYFMIGNFRFIIEENGSMSIARSLTISPQPRVKGYNVSGKVITIYFTPWSSNVSYGYKSNHDSTAIGNIQLLNDEGTALGKTTATGAGYIRITASANLPKNVLIVLPYHVVYNIGQANSDYDLTDVGNDAITLAITTDI